MRVMGQALLEMIDSKLKHSDQLLYENWDKLLNNGQIETTITPFDRKIVKKYYK